MYISNIHQYTQCIYIILYIIYIHRNTTKTSATSPSLPEVPPNSQPSNSISVAGNHWWNRQEQTICQPPQWDQWAHCKAMGERKNTSNMVIDHPKQGLI